MASLFEWSLEIADGRLQRVREVFRTGGYDCGVDSAGEADKGFFEAAFVNVVAEA